MRGKYAGRIPLVVCLIAGTIGCSQTPPPPASPDAVAPKLPDAARPQAPGAAPIAPGVSPGAPTPPADAGRQTTPSQYPVGEPLVPVDQLAPELPEPPVLVGEPETGPP
ncbi:MAG: hypothetical protein FJZ01_21875, partial [Candidatus Sericytochromatia bacterium]|nr:hypothetical protein [Candidatus Tanganyikabacteria bacterium]